MLFKWRFVILPSLMQFRQFCFIFHLKLPKKLPRLFILKIARACHVRKNKHSIILTCTCAYQGVINASFPESLKILKLKFQIYKFYKTRLKVLNWVNYSPASNCEEREWGQLLIFQFLQRTLSGKNKSESNNIGFEFNRGKIQSLFLNFIFPISRSSPNLFSYWLFFPR